MDAMVIHALPVGGGILAISPLPGAQGAYAEDLAHLHEWKPAWVITLTTMAEMVAAGASELGPDIQDSGTRWAHLPIPDFGAPDSEFNDRWPEISASALKALDGGGRVLVHCRGGCGRSGMVALRLMIEAGESALTALGRLRGVRDCAVETDAQMKWAVQVPVLGADMAVFKRHPT